MPNEPESATSKFRIKTIDIEDEEIRRFQVPSFVNHTNIWHYGHDVYIDMALVTVEQLNALKPESDITVATLDRFVMSPLAFNDFARRVNLVRELLKTEGLIRDEATETA